MCRNSNYNNVQNQIRTRTDRARESRECNRLRGLALQLRSSRLDWPRAKELINMSRVIARTRSTSESHRAKPRYWPGVVKLVVIAPQRLHSRTACVRSAMIQRTSQI